ncbi:NAD-dependent epimerase/dehydratase family protein [Flavobacterium sp. JAS]|uniref:NAD-dependent epimerase/dehydratase family protein n=1 Tax=Flavobacterium sp. JAS TaxID=2897329 RepID=UPI001E3CA82E|nr:NAD-dependent epimerase/dehydratase family protein [Flavobacterium sp. JAS]MCD0471067.1 NAD-dependent epimerase/dehydratase family protein [Flavobacterium sp. JAS]
MKIIITGASGFVGQNLMNYLQDTNKIELLSIRYQFSNELVIKGDAIIHLAGKAHDLKKVSSEKEYFEANFELTKKLFNAFLKSESKDFIYFSSVKAIADKVSGILYENDKANPKTIYGQSKFKAEEYILSQEIPEEKRVIIIRPCMIHGPGNKGNLNLLYSVIKKGIPYPLAAFENERSFLGIDNLNFLVKAILEDRTIPSGVYNFADDEFLSTNELVNIISAVLKVKNKKIAIPKNIIHSMARIGDLIRLPLNSETIQKLTENYRVSNHKVKEVIGIKKLPYTTKQGLEKTIKSFIDK